MKQREVKELRRKVVEEVKAGASIDEVCQKFRMRETTVVRYIKQAEREARSGICHALNRKARAERRKRIAIDVDNGMPLDEVCRKYGVAISAAYLACREHGINAPKQKAVSASSFAILSAILDGASAEESARMFKVSKARVYKIVESAKKGGLHEAKLFRTISRLQAVIKEAMNEARSAQAAMVNGNAEEHIARVIDFLRGGA